MTGDLPVRDELKFFGKCAMILKSEVTMNELSSLTVLYHILSDPLIAASASEDRLAFLRLAYEYGTETHIAKYFADAVLSDDNAFSRACASGSLPSAHVRQAYLADLMRIGAVLSDGEGFSVGQTPALLDGWNEAALSRLERYYAENGCGIWLRHTAFRYAAGELRPILTPSAASLSDLKGYAEEKAAVRDNFENFVRGLPYSDMLLYGDRGTGKSSTVHAMVNLFARDKLRLVEIDKENILSLPALRAQLAPVPMKFVVFIDDFSLREDDDRVSTLKAALQGSMEGHAGNVMIVATSNRRHIVDESFATRMNSVHAGDSEEELLSLADRFGITVLFSSTNKAQYLAIVHAIAEDLGLRTPRDRLDLLAERWALERGGRSPRRARQFADYIFACEKKNKPVT